MPGKRIQFSEETWAAIDFRMKSRRLTLQQLADEAFREYLEKHGAPVSLAEQLRKSAGDEPKPAAASKPVQRPRKVAATPQGGKPAARAKSQARADVRKAK